MNQRQQKRRKSSAKFYDAIIDRRVQADRRNQPVLAVPAIPGTIRPLPGEPVQVERRRFPESGTE